jgi:lipid-A-disaccharide synthase-like uncharacterized protein
VKYALEAIGWLGQALFAGRVIYQWFASERAGRALIPRGYWGLSLVGAALVLIYGAGTKNVVFVMSVLPGAVIAFLNIRIRRKSSRKELLPWAVALLALAVWAAFVKQQLGTPFWAGIGLIGALFWSLRHVFQWWVSERLGAPTLPVSFYLLSIVGSLLLFAYAISIWKPVMIAGYAFNFVPYLRLLRLLRASPTNAAARSS